MLTGPTIMKFGGTSVEDAGAFQRAAAIAASAAGMQPVVVVSAIGGFTNALLASVTKAIDGDAPAATKSLDNDFERHVAIANELLGGEARATVASSIADAKRAIRQLHKIIASHPVTSQTLQDEIVAFGELLSSQLFAAVLCENGLVARCVDARRCIKTDESYGSAAPLDETETATQAELLPLFDAGEITVLGGFIGSTSKGVTTTLGRGGSDYSAAIVGAALP